MTDRLKTVYPPKTSFCGGYNKNSILEINGYNVFTCPRPKSNRKARRDSGGVAFYFKTHLADGIKLL